MYPFARFSLIALSERRKPPMALYETHRLPMRCLPWDVDGFGEMNNGRVFTLYDIGRFSLAIRIGLVAAMRREGWGLVVAGSTIRYRSRITPLQRIELRTRFLGWDHRFFYLEQAMWRGETCCNHGLLRTAVTKNGRMAPVEDVARALGVTEPSAPLPDWAKAWAEADGTRPWPPQL